MKPINISPTIVITNITLEGSSSDEMGYSSASAGTGSEGGAAAGDDLCEVSSAAFKRTEDGFRTTGLKRCLRCLRFTAI